MLLYLHDLLAALALPLWSLSIAQLPTGWAKKRGHKLMSIILANLKRFTKFLTGRFHGKFAVNWLLKCHQFLHMLPHYLVKH